MKSLFIAAAAAALMVSAAGEAFADAPASLSAPCTLVQAAAASATPCLFGGNITNSNLTTVDSAYNGQSPAPSIALDLESFLTSPDKVVDSSAGMGTKSGTINADTGYEIDYYAVKGGNGFALYWIDPTTSVNWTTGDLCVGTNCRAPGLSHIVFFESLAQSIPSVPEPATWAMMLVGAFGMGALLRRRQSPTLA